MGGCMYVYQALLSSGLLVEQIHSRYLKKKGKVR